MGTYLKANCKQQTRNRGTSPCPGLFVFISCKPHAGTPLEEPKLKKGGVHQGKIADAKKKKGPHTVFNSSTSRKNG